MRGRSGPTVASGASSNQFKVPPLDPPIPPSPELLPIESTLTVRVAATDAHVVDDVVGIEARPAFDGRALAPLNNLYIFAGVASGADAAVQSAERLIERAFNLWRYREPPATIHRLFGFTPLSSQTTRKA